MSDTIFDPESFCSLFAFAFALSLRNRFCKVFIDEPRTGPTSTHPKYIYIYLTIPALRPPHLLRDHFSLEPVVEFQQRKIATAC